MVVKTKANGDAESGFCPDLSGLREFCPHFDCVDPYDPLCTCSNCNIEKSGFCTTTPNAKVVCFMFPPILCKALAGAVDLFLTPFLLALHFMKIYLIPAVTSVVFGIIEKFICTFNCCKMSFTDIWFPPNDRSIGVKVDNYGRPLQHSVVNLDCWHRGYPYLFCNPIMSCFKTDKVEWVRAMDLHTVVDTEKGESDDESMKLFSGKIEPDDISQGAMGDCWLLASLASIAEKNDHVIRTAFLAGRTSVCGYYKIKMYDVYNGTPQWRIFTVDDKIPVNTGTFEPMFTKPNGKEMWVLLVEKAFAKMMGSYEKLNGNFARVPFRALTGNQPIEFMWNRSNKIAKPWHSENKPTHGIPELDEDELWRVFKGCIENNMIIAAGSTGSHGTNSKGIVGGHMYSVLNVCTTNSGNVKLVQMRNPWGEFEWKGAYSDHDRETKGWKPDMAGGGGIINLNGNGVEDKADDGVFWMPYMDFLKEFPYVCLCAVSENMSSLHLDVHEDMGICGPMYGMCEGAVTFCACCHGAMNLWCPEERSTLEMIMSFRDQSVLEAIGNCMSGSRHSRNADDDESSDSRNPASNNSDRNEHHN